MSTTERAQQAQPAPAAATLLGRAVAAARKPTDPGSRGSTLVRHLTVAVILLAVGIWISYFLPTFRAYQLSLVMVYIAVCAGLTVLIGLNGQISLGHGALMAVGAYATGFTQNFLADRFTNPPPPGATGFNRVPTVQSWTIFASMTVGVLAALVAGLIVGLAAARLRGPYLAGATLAVVGIVPAVTTTFEVFNAGQGIRVKPAPAPAGLSGMLNSSDQWKLWVGMGLVAIVMVLLANLIHSRVGRNFQAVRDDEISAQLSGIPVARTQVVAFIVSAGTAGLAGGLLVYLQGNAQPGAYGVVLSLYLVLAIVIGGLGSLMGAAWGALFLVAIPYLTEWFTHEIHASQELQQKLLPNLPLLVFGLTLIIVTILAPGGIQNALRRLWTWGVGAVRRPAQ